MKIYVIGASATGLKAACRVKRLMPDWEIVVLDKGEYISYGACGLPYYLSGDIDSIDDLMKTTFGVKRTPEFFWNAKGVEVNTGVIVEGIDKSRKTLRIKDLRGNKNSEVAYDKLVIATGANPEELILPGSENEKVGYFKNLEDAMKLRGMLEKGNLGNVGIIGGGFIGCELAEAFNSMWGSEVSLFESHNQLLPAFLDPEMSDILQEYLKNEGIDLHINYKIISFEEIDDKIAINTENGGQFTFDRVVISVGVKPEANLAKQSGLEIGALGGICVNEYLQTSEPDIYAGGDCVENSNLITGKPVYTPMGSLANKHGRIIGSNLAGLNEKFNPVIFSFGVKVFDFNISATGLTEKAAKKDDIKVSSQWGTFTDSAEYYPESKNIHMKLLFDPDSREVLGFQALGTGDTVKRVDVIGSLIKKGRKIDDILDLEFAYAPPYGPPLDSLYSLASAALNQLDYNVCNSNPFIDFNGFDVIVDVRMKEESQLRKIDHPRVINIPLTEFRARVNEIPKNLSILVVCAKGSRSAETALFLNKSGYKNVKYLGGGLLMRPAN